MFQEFIMFVLVKMSMNSLFFSRSSSYSSFHLFSTAKNFYISHSFAQFIVHVNLEFGITFQKLW